MTNTVLTARPGALGLVPVRGVVWSDLGSPDRVFTARARLGRVGAAARAAQARPEYAAEPA
jgi:hypothetical protein